MAFADLLPQTATVTTMVSTEDDYGNPVLTEGAQTLYPCRLQGATGGDAELISGRDTAISLWTLYLLPDAVITALDRVTIADPGSGQDVDYDVFSDPRPMWAATSLHHIEVTLRKVSGG